MGFRSCSGGSSGSPADEVFMDRRSSNEEAAFAHRMREALPDALLAVSPAGAILSWSPGARALFGCEPEADVEDTGIGVSPDDVHRLFIEFQQLDAGMAKRYAGTGLGLALTKRIVEAQGGSVGVRSVPGEGSTFSAVLPRFVEVSRA
ncbi:sensory box histidine kinase/response regulator [Minicystis rosea]|nr:sensory box histidine kinase/response regulator [Minicystis rosea]